MTRRPHRLLPIAITLGDPGGIGPEVTLKALKSFGKTSVPFLLVGPDSLYHSLNKKLRTGLKFRSFSSFEKIFLERHVIPILSLPEFPDAKHYPRGKVAKTNACAAYLSLQEAARLALLGKVRAVVTAPLQKEAMRLVDKNFIGHTEFLAKAAGSKRVAMMFDGGDLIVTLASIHVPLRKVSETLTVRNLLDKLELTDQCLKQNYRKKHPRIAVAALNPHGREFGDEERLKIEPAIRAARRKGIRAEGPLPGDTVFYEAYHGKYDAVLAMYHDQGLAPLKTLAFDRAVNITLGLPFVRTSPDHGTAYDIAESFRARPDSMLAAMRLALKLIPS